MCLEILYERVFSLYFLENYATQEECLLHENGEMLLNLLKGEKFEMGNSHK
jgi:hypothetical protein